MRYTIFIRHTTVFIWILMGLWGCNIPADTPSAPVVVRKKIAATARPLPSKETPLEQKQHTAAVKPAPPPAPMPQPPAPASQKPQPPAVGKPAEPQAPALPNAESKGLAEEKFPPLYNPMGKTDPFQPLVRQASDSKVRKKKKKRIPQTPLEKMDLSQIKLVGILRTEEGSTGLVEESSGKGYVVSKGTYIGLNSGKIVDILKDRLIIEEEFENVLGETLVRKRELKLQKPPGEF